MKPGQIFERKYRIDREIGRGAFGIVYLAEDIETRQSRAIKVLLPWTRNNQSLRHRLRREAKLTRMLKNPNTVRTYDLNETSEGDLYIVMEYLQGDELNELLKIEKKLPDERVLDIAQQVLHALAEAHSLGVIHRDLKPQNIFMCRSEDGRDHVKVLDFGIAKVAGKEDGSGLTETTRLTAPGGVVGTPAYMSPEQCRGEDLAPASDFYSLGVVMYEMVTGRVPFDNENPVQVMIMHNSSPVPLLPAETANTQLGKTIMRALQKERGDRYETADHFLAAIGGMAISPTTNLAETAAQPSSGHEATAATTMSGSSNDNKSRKQSALSTYLIGVVIITLLALLALSRYL